MLEAARRTAIAIALAPWTAGLLGCPADTAQDGKGDPAPATTSPTGPASAPSHHGGGGPGAPTGAGGALPVRSADDQAYIKDPDTFPTRLGVTRIFLRQAKVNHVRDPVFIPGTDTVLFMAKIGGVQGLWTLPRDGSEAAKLVVPKPLYTPGEKPSARNRQNWYIGTPSVFADGKHVIFDGTQFNPKAPYPNVLGLAKLDGEGLVSAVEIEGVDFARTPSPHPDGEHVIFTTCTEVRRAKLKGFGDQKLQSTVVVDLPRVETNSKAVCTVHRPRYSPDGNQIVFEVVGQFLSDEMKAKHKVPPPINQGDYLIEPWIMNADGTNVRRLIKDEAYERDLHGRLQTGGTKEPMFSPDGKWIVFAHGRSTAMVTADGTKGRIVSSPIVETQRAVQFMEGDPAFSSDGRYIAVGSTVQGTEDNPRPAPPGIAIIDLSALDLAP